MRAIELNIQNAIDTPQKKATYNTLLKEAQQANQALHDGTREGADFLGWVDLPHRISTDELSDIQSTAEMLRQDCEYVVSIGIGGSYLGAKAVIEAMGNSFGAYLPRTRQQKETKVLFAGNSISEDYLFELVELLRGKKFGLINISKSGTTTEPAIAFRILKQLLENQEGIDFARKHIIAVTDQKAGALRKLTEEEGYTSYAIPENVGGRFSVLTPVGLLPIAVAGYDIRALVDGAKDMAEEVAKDHPIEKNVSAQYAAARNTLYRMGKKIEIVATFEPKMHYIAEWWKQLYGESEGKQHKSLFNASVSFTTDLHSLGQSIQEGERSIFETFISVDEPRYQMLIPEDLGNLDGLNYLAGKRIHEVNKMAELGTMLAHTDGGVPIINVTIPKLDEYHIGQLFFFFEKAVGISGYLLGVNPFDQPGVEAYKSNMFALLEKPGHEAKTQELKARLGNTPRL